MLYKCKTVPIAKALITPKGMIEPLCSSCKTADCDNPIENKKISIVGITKEMRVYTRGDEAYYVVSCEGFMS